VIARLKREPETEGLGRGAERWIYVRGDRGVIWDEVNDIRNAAAPRSTTTEGPPGPVRPSVAESCRIRRRREGMVLEFSQEWVEHVQQLKTIIDRERELWDLPRVELVEA
jgi:hypothetical protein